MAQACSGLAGGAPLFTALLNYRHTALQDADAGDAWTGVQILQSHERTNFPFGLSVNDTGEGFTLIAHVIDAVNAHSMCGYMHEALDGLARSEEHTSELQSQSNLVCRLLLEKKKKKTKNR